VECIDKSYNILYQWKGIEQYFDGNSNKQLGVIRGLRSILLSMRRSNTTFEQLIEIEDVIKDALSHKNKKLVRTAAECLFTSVYWLKSDAMFLIPEMKTLLDSSNDGSTVQYILEVISSLVYGMKHNRIEFNSSIEVVLPKTFELLDDKNRKVRIAAAYTLRAFLEIEHLLKHKDSINLMHSFNEETAPR